MCDFQFKIDSHLGKIGGHSKGKYTVKGREYPGMHMKNYKGGGGSSKNVCIPMPLII